ncbi:hypothetical protein O6H91_11G011800 [Diphasiastrum complanatum]|uniref:Uncharacterized protein n=1 Tax=Diphasiastrum complanatum TaxID=34168 RepID=A0ACC2C6B9_DIPCM|nr:hypothetical protein O6H91_11G011800 [Diphasiastrum complanatum]
MEEWLGISAALGSIIFFGSYAVPIKLPHVVEARVDPVVFQFYKSIACFLTSWLLLLYLVFQPFQFTWWGILGGAMWVFNGIGAILGITWAGIGAAQAIWSGLSVFISYFWGAYVFGEPVESQLLAISALLVMALGMVGVALAAAGKLHLKYFSSFHLPFRSSVQFKKIGVKAGEQEKDLLTSFIGERDTKVAISTDFTHYEVVASLDKKPDSDHFMKGILCAAAVGVVNGSLMVPLKYAHKDVVGAEYLFSFGIGTMGTTLIVTSLYYAFLLLRGKPWPSFQISKASFPALTTGLFWSAGNYCSIYATLYLGMALGWPLVQCQLLISAMWAVFYFKETEGKTAALVLMVSSLTVVLGAIMLSWFGTVG